MAALAFSCAAAAEPPLRIAEPGKPTEKNIALVVRDARLMNDPQFEAPDTPGRRIR
jgi:hypothetical protein